MRSSLIYKTLFFLSACLLSLQTLIAHPGSGIVVDAYGQVYFTDTGKGVWKIELSGKLTFLPSSRFHWMAIDHAGRFAASAKEFGQYFERVTAQSKPVLILCSDFPNVIGKDGNMYYADTRPGTTSIIRRTPDGQETVLAKDKIFQFISGITVGNDGSLYFTEASNAGANTVRRITMKGKISIIATYSAKPAANLPLETEPSYCRGLAIDPTGTIYVAATGSRSVIKISPQGKVTTILQVNAPWTPTGIAVFNGSVYVLEWHDVSRENLEVRTAYIPRVRKIAADGTVSTIAMVSRD
jgi:sugar lactone lactonase YvrE